MMMELEPSARRHTGLHIGTTFTDRSAALNVNKWSYIGDLIMQLQMADDYTLPGKTSLRGS